MILNRNLTHMRASLLDVPAAAAAQIHPMPVDSTDLDAGTLRYAEALAGIAGSPPVLDLVHLGMGPDGHTASLVPGDPVLHVKDADVALTGPYQGRRRMTLTYPVLNRARRVLWLITGEDKAGMLPRLQRGDTAIPAGEFDRITHWCWQTRRPHGKHSALAEPAIDAHRTLTPGATLGGGSPSLVFACCQAARRNATHSRLSLRSRWTVSCYSAVCRRYDQPRRRCASGRRTLPIRRRSPGQRACPSPRRHSGWS